MRSILFLSLFLYLFCCSAASAQISGQWVDALQNRHGNTCCQDNDGRRLIDPEWDTLGRYVDHPEGPSGYRVLDWGVWRDVPNSAVVTMPNQDGIPRVWFREDGVRGRVVFCFLPGALG